MLPLVVLRLLGKVGGRERGLPEYFAGIFIAFRFYALTMTISLSPSLSLSLALVFCCSFGVVFFFLFLLHASRGMKSEL